MAFTVADILKQTGFTDEQIAAIDSKQMEGFTRVVSSANDAQEKAEFALRAQREEYDKNIAPALANWADQDTRLSTENAAMKAYLAKIKDSGYLPPEVASAMPGVSSPNPNPNPAVRTPDGRFVAGANPVPGSPGFVDTEKKLRDELAGAFTFAVDTQWKYRQLFGTEMPDSPTAIIREAAQQRMDPQAWAAKKYDFQAKEKSIIEAKQREHDDKIRKEAVQETEKKWAERMGNNPNVRTPSESQFSEVNKAVAEGKRKDPLKMTPEERKVNTHTNIQKEFSERSSMVN